MNLYNYVAGTPFPPSMPEGFSERKFGHVDVVLFALAADQNSYFYQSLAGRLQTSREFRGLVYSLSPENRDYLKCADFFRVPDFPSYIVVSYKDFRKFLCVEPYIEYLNDEREGVWNNRDYRRELSYYRSDFDAQGINLRSRLDYAIINGYMLERDSSSNIEEKVLELARGYCEGRATVDNSVLLVRSISRKQLDYLKLSILPLVHGTEITVLFSRPAWRHTEFERILYDAFISFGAATDDVLVKILYPSYISDEYVKCRTKYHVVKLPAAIFSLGQTGQLVVKVERDFFERMPDLRERITFLISDIHLAIADGHTTVAKELVNELSSAVGSQAISIEESTIANGMNIIQLRPGSIIVIHEREDIMVEDDTMKDDGAEEDKEGAIHMSTISPAKMPSFGQPFLEPSERREVIKIVGEVIKNMSTLARENLLVSSRIPNNLIGRISYSTTRPTNNVATDIVMTLEGNGVLDTDTHIFGSFLNQVIAETAGYDACAYMVAIIFRYNLLRNREQVRDLSSRFQVPSPELTAEFYSNLALAPLPERLRPSNYLERLESLRRDGIKRYLNVNFLLDGARAVRSVCKVEFDGVGEGTGFLVAPNLVLTNYHVLMPFWYRGTMEDRIKTSAVRFGAITDEDGGVKAGAWFRLSNEKPLAFSERQGLDYVLLRLQESVPTGGLALPISLSQREIQAGEHVNIIHHPNNGPMEVSLRENEVVAVEGRYVYYLADTEDGSSGAPVFDDKWKVVALHRAGREKDATGNMLVDANAGVPINLVFGEIKPYLNS